MDAGTFLAPCRLEGSGEGHLQKKARAPRPLCLCSGPSRYRVWETGVGAGIMTIQGGLMGRWDWEST